MSLLDVFGYLLIAITMLLAAYAVRCVCRAKRTRRNPRPYAMPVFSLLAFGLMKACWIAGGFVDRVDYLLAVIMLATDYAVITSIGWLLYHSTKRRTFRGFV